MVKFRFRLHSSVNLSFEGPKDHHLFSGIRVYIRVKTFPKFCSVTIPFDVGPCYLAKNSHTALAEHAPYSLDLRSADLFLFPRLSTSSKGERFADADVVKQNVSKPLKIFLKHEFKRRMNVGAGVLFQKESYFFRKTGLYYCSINSFKEMFWNLLTPVVDPNG